MSQLKVNTIRHTGASSDAVTLATDGTCTAKITNNLSNRNLIINGAMQIAQRGTSSTSTGFKTADRWEMYAGGANTTLTQSISDVAAGTTPYQLGFRKAFKLLNAGQSGPDADDAIRIQQKIEDQNIATSGWNYKSASSYLTLSFWVKSSVAQTFVINLLNRSDESSLSDIRNYSTTFSVGSADTWTKITHSIPGSSTLTFDNDNTRGITVGIFLMRGTDNTTSGHSAGAWATYSGSDLAPDMTSTWWTTSNATFELTGVQLEVGDHATDFEHRSYTEEYLKCCRYYYKIADGSVTQDSPLHSGTFFGAHNMYGPINYPVAMRAAPTMHCVTGTGYYQCYYGTSTDAHDAITLNNASPTAATLIATTNLTGTSGASSWCRTTNTSSYVALTAEL